MNSEVAVISVDQNNNPTDTLLCSMPRNARLAPGENSGTGNSTDTITFVAFSTVTYPYIGGKIKVHSDVTILGGLTYRFVSWTQKDEFACWNTENTQIDYLFSGEVKLIEYIYYDSYPRAISRTVMYASPLEHYYINS